MTPSPPIGQKWLRVRLAIAASVLTGLFGLLAYKAWALQIRDGAKMQELGLRQVLQELVLPAPRGTIRDANGVELAVTVNVDSAFGVLAPRSWMSRPARPSSRPIARIWTSARSRRGWLLGQALRVAETAPHARRGQARARAVLAGREPGRRAAPLLSAPRSRRAGPRLRQHRREGDRRARAGARRQAAWRALDHAGHSRSSRRSRRRQRPRSTRRRHGHRGDAGVDHHAHDRSHDAVRRGARARRGREREQGQGWPRRRHGSGERRGPRDGLDAGLRPERRRRAARTPTRTARRAIGRSWTRTRPAR